MKTVSTKAQCRNPHPIACSPYKSAPRTLMRKAACSANKNNAVWLPDRSVDRLEKQRAADRQAVRQELLNLCEGTQMGYASSAKQDSRIAQAVGRLERFNPTPAPAGRQDLLCRSWRLVYSNLPQLEQKLLFRKEKSSRHCQNLDVLSFFTLGFQQAELEKVSQVIRPDGTYSMVQSICKDSVQGQLLARGRFEVKNASRRPERFHVTFSQVGLRFDGEQDDVARFRKAMGIAGDNPNERCINLTNHPSSYSDCTYLDGELRVARAMLGALYVLVPERDTFGSLVELSATADAQKKGQLSRAALNRLPKLFGGKS